MNIPYTSQDYPLSQSQLGIYFECISREGEAAYNNGLLYRLGADVNTGQLATAFEKVIEAHPFVKTRITVNDNGLPRQRRNDEPFKVTVERMTTEQFEVEKPQLIQPFYLLSDRLFRIRIIETPQSAFLFLDFHHIIYDGKSLEILFSDLTKAYNDEAVAQEDFSGFDVAMEEESLRATQAYEEAKSWYQQQFGNLKTVSMPYPDKTEAVTVYGCQKLELAISDQQLREAGRRMGVSSGTILTAAFGYMLGAYTYQDNALFATIYHGRQDSRTQRTVSMLVKTLPVYMTWNRQTTVRELLQTTSQMIRSSRAYSVFSFADLKALNPNISSQVLFAYQGDYDASTAVGELPFEQVPLMDNATGELLAIEIIRHNGKLTLRAEYHGNVYSSSYITRLMDSYDRIVRGFVEAADGSIPVGSLALLSDNNTQQLLNMSMGETLTYDSSETFVSMFLRQAALTPDAIAIVDKYTSITYHELDRQSNVLASSLVQAGVTSDSPVALLLSRRKEFLIAVLAVFKAGGAYVSLDSEYPVSRLDFMLNDLNAHYLITTSKLVKTVATDRFTEGGGLFLLDHFDFSVNASPIDNSRPESLAYILYTSGTSGLPKGVMVEHRALCAMLEWVVPMEGLKPGDRCAEHASFSFDASIVDLFAPLTCGAEVHIISSSLRFDMGSVSDYLTSHDIKGLTMSTQVGMELLDSHDPKIQYLFMGGEKLHPVRKNSVKQINGYGPTEFTVCSSYHVVDQDTDNDSIPIGRPVPNSTSVIVSPTGTLVPWGAVGELCLMGTQLARGYWQRESQTNEKFVDCPFMPGRKMYHTGDLAQWNQDGELLFMGRIDNQIKLRGYRIELDEIESRINDYPGVQASAVVLSRQSSVEYLTGYYIAETAIPPKVLRDWLTSQLPNFMIPSKLIQIDRMPMTLNGKIDRRSLEEQTSVTPVTPQHIDLPAGTIETVLYSLVKELLGTDTFGVTDDLTLLGLSSFDAIRLVSMAKKSGIALKVNEIMQGRTIRRIAQKDSSIGRWQKGYHAEKHVVVAIQGFSPYKVHQYFDALCEQFSVYTFTSLEDYLTDNPADYTKSDIVALYLETLQGVLPPNAQPIAFVGHCYGGELAYRCAVQWQARTGQMPKVVLLNTPSRTDEEIRQMMPSQSDIDRMTDEQLTRLNGWRVQHEIVLSLIDGVPLPAYQGEVIFYKALLPYQEANKLNFDGEGLARQDALYEQRWRALVSNLTIIPVPTDHFTMLEAQYINLYLDKI